MHRWTHIIKQYYYRTCGCNGLSDWFCPFTGAYANTVVSQAGTHSQVSTHVQVSVAAFVQTYEIYIPGKRPRGPK